VQSAWDSMFAETEMGEAIREFRKIDPDFTMEGFVEEMEEKVIPVVLGAYLREDLPTLNQYLGEGAFAAVKAAVDERRRAERRMDPNILNIQHAQVAAAKVVEKMQTPMIVLQFMAQQIDCLYDKTGTNVVEGNDNKVSAVFYAFAMTRERSETDGTLKWVIKEFAIVGMVPWI
jgi:mitochondrial import inner membrane translocase subunit TIM44